MYCGCSESETWQSDPRWSAVTCAFVISPSPAVALLCRREILMCVMCSLRVCIPGEILGAEAGERNESCAVNHSLPRRRRRGDACRKQQLHTKRTTATHREVGYISTCPTAVCSTDALTHAEWHISTLLFFSRAQISPAERFPSWALLYAGLLVCTNLHLRLPKLKMLEGEDAK